MSTINTNGLDVNYPVPGQNNSSQGFRNNFTNIKQNLNLAANEISDLQNKAVLKSALANSTIDNNMANTLISNAAILQFRHTTYNLGNALTGTVLVNCSLGDVQYGNIAGNILLTFGNWANTNTLSTVRLHLGRPNNEANFSITFPPEAVVNKNSGWAILENSNVSSNLATVTFPNDVTQINLTLTSTDCGNTIFVEPTNRPFQSTQIQQRSPSPTGFLGDVAGTVAVDSEYLYVCTNNFDSTLRYGNAVSTNGSTNVITFSTNIQAANIDANMPVVFDTMFINGNSVTNFANIIAGQIYYVKTISGGNITISDFRTYDSITNTYSTGNTLALTTVTANANTNMDATFYDGSDIWKRISLTSW